MTASVELVKVTDSPEQAKLLDRARGYAWRVARHRGLSLEHSDDAAQQAATQVWKALHKLDPARDPWPFVAHVVRQTVVLYSMRMSRKDIPVGQTPDVDGTSPHWDSTEEQGCASWDSEAVRQAVAQLPRKQRQVLECLYYRQLSYRETAVLMGYSVANKRRESAAVVKLRRKALDTLKGLLSATYGEEVG